MCVWENFGFGVLGTVLDDLFTGISFVIMKD